MTAASDSGTSSSDDITSVTTPTFAGTADAGSADGLVVGDAGDLGDFGELGVNESVEAVGAGEDAEAFKRGWFGA